MTEKTSRKHKPAEYVIQTRADGNAPWRDTNIDTTACRDTAACLRLLREQGQPGAYRIVAVKRVLNVKTEQVSKITLS